MDGWLDRDRRSVVLRRRTLTLSPPQRAELEQVRDHDRRAYLRERAAALLKIADGQSAHAVARHGLLKPRAPDTVSAWLTAYQAQGLAGLVQRPRGWRGFSPAAAARAGAGGAAGPRPLWRGADALALG